MSRGNDLLIGVLSRRQEEADKTPGAEEADRDPIGAAARGARRKLADPRERLNEILLAALDEDPGNWHRVF